MGTQLPGDYIGRGGIVQVQKYASGVYTSTSVIMNPLNSSGGIEWGNVSITPKSASNLLIIHFFGNTWCSTGPQLGLFKNSESNPIMPLYKWSGSSAGYEFYTFTYSMTAGTTSPIIFRIRFGPVTTGSMQVCTTYTSPNDQAGIYVTEVAA